MTGSEGCSELQITNGTKRENVLSGDNKNNESNLLEARYRELFKTGLEAVIVGSAEGYIVDVNLRFVSLSGYSEEELIGAHLSSIFSEEDLRQVPFQYEELKKGELVIRERNLICKNGTSIPVEMISQELPIGNCQTIFHDIRNRKETEEKLKHSEEIFSRIFKITPDAVTISKLSNGSYIDVNNGFLSLLGYTIEEVMEKSPLPSDLGIWVNKEDREKMVDELTKNGEISGIEAQFRRKNGTIIYGTLSARVLELNGEKCCISVTRDMSEKKQQQDALRESEKRYREMANSLPLAIFESDLNSRLTFVNSTAMEWYGYTQEDLQKGLYGIQLIVPQERARAQENIRRIITDKTAKSNEYQTLKKDGSTFDILMVTRPISDNNGNPVGFRGTIIDITERKKIEKVLQNAQRLQSLGVLAGGIAHDFNNLLSGLFGYLDMAETYLKEGDITNGKECIGKAVSVFSRAKALTGQLLTFSKGGQPVKMCISIASVLKETVPFSLSGSCVKADFDIPDDLWNCEADVHQIGQVVDNIIINARQSMQNGGVITIVTRNEDKQIPEPLAPGKYVVIMIRDNGTGIPEEILPHIFDPFFTTKQKGSGLGLATSYSIVNKHGGHIFAESTMGVGSTFTLYLPASLGKTEQTTVVSDNLPAQKENSRVLLMDDEKFIRDIGLIALKELGCTVDLAEDGSEAVTIFRKAKNEGHPFDLVIVDLTIPGGMGGIQALEELKQADPSIKVIASSGYSDDPVMADPCKYGFIAKIAKPYLKGALQKVVSSVLATDDKTK